MRIGIYALAKDESKNVPAWEASCRDADVRVVTDTGSSDDTVQMLRDAGVDVVFGDVVPWRWDDAHNLALQHLPRGVDVCIRLDLDEVLEPGWRAIVEEAWTAETTQLRYWYAWSGELKILCDRIHARSGYRWGGATHEGLMCWDGPHLQTVVDKMLIRHHREPGKVHGTDLNLLRRSVVEAPHDARMRWYLARELDYARDPEATATFLGYLDMPGGIPQERAYACRQLALLEPQKARLWLQRAILESPAEPEGYLRLAHHYQEQRDPVGALHFARAAAECDHHAMSHTSETGAYGAYPCVVAARAAASLGLADEAALHARVGIARDPKAAQTLQDLLPGGVVFDKPGPRPN